MAIDLSAYSAYDQPRGREIIPEGSFFVGVVSFLADKAGPLGLATTRNGMLSIPLMVCVIGTRSEWTWQTMVLYPDVGHTSLPDPWSADISGLDEQAARRIRRGRGIVRAIVEADAAVRRATAVLKLEHPRDLHGRICVGVAGIEKRERLDPEGKPYPKRNVIWRLVSPETAEDWQAAIQQMVEHGWRFDAGAAEARLAEFVGRRSGGQGAAPAVATAVAPAPVAAAAVPEGNDPLADLDDDLPF